MPSPSIPTFMNGSSSKLALVPSGSDGRVTKIDMAVAAIERDILENDRIPGDFIGNETKLTERYGTTSATLRQAVRLLEIRHVVEMRSGIQGGLFVASASPAVVGRTLATFFSLSGLSSRDLLPICEEIALASGLQASSRMNAQQAEEIEASLERTLLAQDPYEYALGLIDLFQSVAETTENPLIELIFSSTAGALYHLTPQNIPEEDINNYKWHPRPLIEAIIAGRVDEVAVLMRDSWQRIQKLDMVRNDSACTAQSEAQPGQIVVPITPQSRSNWLAHEFMRDIRNRNVQNSYRLGTETDLLIQYQVSRATFRQAMQILMEFGAVEVRRGSSGGIFAIPPDATKIEDLVARAVKPYRWTQADRLSVFQIMISLSVELAIRNNSSMPALAEMCEKQRTLSARDCCLSIGLDSGNRAVDLLLRIMIQIHPSPMVTTPRKEVAAIARAMLANIESSRTYRARRAALDIARYSAQCTEDS